LSSVAGCSVVRTIYGGPSSSSSLQAVSDWRWTAAQRAPGPA